MKFEGTRKSKDGSDTTIFIFAMNAKEAQMLLSLAAKLKQLLPRFWDGGAIHGRLRNIASEISKALTTHGFKKHADYEKELYE